MSMMKLWVSWFLAAVVTMIVTSPHSLRAESLVLAKKYEIDPAHSAIEFEIGFMGLTKVRGRFTDYQGSIMVDSDDPTNTTTTVIIKAESIDTDNDFRDNHLRSPDYFDVENHPTISFQSYGVVRSAEGLVMHGSLSIHGVTKNVAIPFRVLHGEKLDAWGNRRVGFVGNLVLNRKEYGVKGGSFWNQTIEVDRMAVSDEVEIHLNVQGQIANMDRINFGPPDKPAIGRELLKLIDSDGFQAARQRYLEAKVEETDRYEFNEWQLSVVGYKLLQAGRSEDAIQVFQLAAQEFPESANAYDSLGEAYMVQGDGETSLEAYRKALHLNPNLTSAIEMIRWLEDKTTRITLQR